MKKYKKILIKIAVSIVLFSLIFSKLSIKEAYANFSEFNFWFAPLIFLFLILNYLVSSVRWKKLLIFENCDDIKISYLTSLYFMGAFFNNFMPTSIGGDVFKVVKLGNKINSKSHAFSATFMERFTGMIALVLVSYLGLTKTLDFWISLLPQNISSNHTLVLLFEFLLFFGFWVVALCAYIALKIFSKKISKLKKIHDSLMLYKGNNNVLIWALITSFIVQLLGIFAQYYIFSALGVALPIFYALFIFPMITLASFFIPSLNGVGVQDALYVQLFSIVGIPAEVSVSASIIYHLFRLGVSLIGGLLYATEKDNS